MKKLEQIFYVFVASAAILSSPLIVLADEAETVGGEEPQWFYLLEILGIVVAAIGLWYICKIVKAQSQGALGKAFRYYGAAVSSISVSLAYKSVTEYMRIEHGFIHEFIYEIFVYIGIILIAIGSNVAYKVLADISNMAKKQ